MIVQKDSFALCNIQLASWHLGQHCWRCAGAKSEQFRLPWPPQHGSSGRSSQQPPSLGASVTTHGCWMLLARYPGGGST